MEELSATRSKELTAKRERQVAHVAAGLPEKGTVPHMAVPWQAAHAAAGGAGEGSRRTTEGGGGRQRARGTGCSRGAAAGGSGWLWW
eukprot:4482757-Prymnesium_polylepis.3